jgi:hypothetical protein
MQHRHQRLIFVAADPYTYERKPEQFKIAPEMQAKWIALTPMSGHFLTVIASMGGVERMTCCVRHPWDEREDLELADRC